MYKYELEKLDYFELFSEYRDIDFKPENNKIKLAILGDCATQQIHVITKTLFYLNDFQAEIYEAPFDSIELELFNPSSGLYDFKPDLIVIIRTIQQFRTKFYLSKLKREDFFSEESEKLSGILQNAQNNFHIPILVSNLVLPVENVFGTFETKTGDSLVNLSRKMNQYLSDFTASQKNIYVLDFERTASYHGRKNFLDETLWYHSKTPCALDYIPYISQEVVDLVVSLKIRSVKAVVLDLDNTLWGGVIGDDGLEGIALGHLGEGEPFVDFQHFILELKKRGIILAVCSKNQEENALLPFREHPEMVLKESDISIFVANWNNKADNIKFIKESLNIGYDSIVFLDDNPYERNLVRQFLPEVIVPELPEDPALYVRHISELNLFQTVSYTDEDKERGDMYRVEFERQSLQKSYNNIDDYLKSLEMKIGIKRFDTFHLPRIAQLIQRSNQFNLTTLRYTEEECSAFMEDKENYFPFYIKLKDKFGDYGLISVVIVKNESESYLIDEWIMSCRVLARGVEQFMMNQIFLLASQNGKTKVKGTYIPTSKNSMVKDFYQKFGFECIESGEDGSTFWSLDVSKYNPSKVFLEEEV